MNNVRRIVCFFVLAALVQPHAFSSQDPSPSFGEWARALEMLSQADSNLAGGKTEDVVAFLEDAQKTWPSPISDVADDYLEKLATGDSSPGDGFGVSLFTGRVLELEDPEIRAPLEEMVLNLVPTRENPSASIFLGRGLAQFRAANIEGALSDFQKGTKGYPNSD